MTNVLRGLALVAKEQSTDDERVEGLAPVAKERSTDDERVEGPSSSGKGAKHWWRNMRVPHASREDEVQRSSAISSLQAPSGDL